MQRDSAAATAHHLNSVVLLHKLQWRLLSVHESDTTPQIGSVLFTLRTTYPLSSGIAAGKLIGYVEKSSWGLSYLKLVGTAGENNLPSQIGYLYLLLHVKMYLV